MLETIIRIVEAVLEELKKTIAKQPACCGGYRS